MLPSGVTQTKDFLVGCLSVVISKTHKRDIFTIYKDIRIAVSHKSWTSTTQANRTP